MPQHPRVREYQNDREVLVNDEGLRFFKPFTLNVDGIAANIDDTKYLPAGTFIVESATAGEYLAYPRLLAKADAPTTQNYIEFLYPPTVFPVGEEIFNAADVSLGIVQSIDFNLRRVVLTANLAQALTAGNTVKRPDALFSSAAGAVKAFSIKAQDVGSPHGKDAVSGFHAATMYEARMPYIDDALKTQFEDLLFW